MRQLTILAGAAALWIASVASAEAEFIPPWIMGNGPPGAPVYGVVTPPGAHPWVGPTIPFLGTPIYRVGYYTTRVRANNQWLRAQICDFLDGTQ